MNWGALPDRLAGVSKAAPELLARAIVLLLVLLVAPMTVSAQQSGATFDHVSTTFPLTGAHEQVRCETCHIKGIFKGTPRECAGCHIPGNQRGALAKPFNHIQTNQTCDTCHTAGSFTGALFSHVGVTPGSCASCHNGVRAPGKTAGHVATTLSCDQCHGTSAFLPVRRFDHQALSGNFTTCATCHDGRTAKGQPANHIPTPQPAPCGTCHVASIQGGFTSFSGGQMDHTRIATGCASCHGPGVTGATFAGITSIVTMPATTPVGAGSHIPSTTTCETCHLANRPVGLIPANASRSAPGSGFGAPAPTGVQIHSGISGGCSSCHEGGYVWMGMGAYPISPTTIVADALYRGFQTRPKAAASTFSVADAAHPNTGECSQCHFSTTAFSAQEKPPNHIPTSASAQCSACHTSSDYSVLPTLANIHANAPSTTSNCAQCHGAAAPSFAIPSANFSIVGLPGNHIPTSASCEACHVGAGSSITATPVGNGAKFSGSRMSHAGITNNCAACHGPTIGGSSFVGVSKIIVMPATSPVGANSHIPSSTTCESCHLGTVPAGLIPAVATRSTPGSLFATPAPTGAQIHSGITGSCSSCHETNYVWMGMASYPIAPTTLTSGAQYTGFQTRPRAAAGTYNVADAAHPATGDCSQCHSGTNFFSAQTKPAGHLPTQVANCSTCHVVAGDFSIAGLTTSMATLHTGVTSGCLACHSAGTGAGPFAGCTTQASCANPPPLTYQPKTTPLAPGGSPTAPSAQTHIPSVGITCERCHSATVFTSFAGMNMKGNTTAHAAVAAASCQSCHEYPYAWFGVQIRTPGSTNHHGRAPAEDCTSSGCHRKSYSQFVTEARVRPVLRSAIGGASSRVLPDGTPLFAPGAGAQQAFDHQGVLPGQCQTCHNGQAAKGQPIRHLATRVSCDSCHRSTAWTPAQFSHQGVLPGQCQTCHNGSSATGKSSGHFVTARSCDACHRTIGWVPTHYSHLSSMYRPQPDKLGCTGCHVTNGEIIPRQLRGNPRPRPIPGP